MKQLKLSLLVILMATGYSYANSPSPHQMRSEMGAMPLPNLTNLALTPIATLPTPKSTISDTVRVPTILIAATTANHTMLDVTLIDDFIADVSPNARHYPPNFPNRTTQYLTKETIKYLSAWLEPYATAPNASFEVLLRATKINAMGRNLDLGSDYGVRASTHIANALKLQPNHAEANFLFGMMLSEGGGFKEGKKYLDKAVKEGYLEAEQSLAQADLLSENRSGALARLQKLQAQYPDNLQLAEQINIVNNGGFYIWDIKDSTLDLKPLSQ